MWSLLGGLLSGLWNALFGWLSRREEDAKNVQLGQQQQKVTDEEAALKEQQTVSKAGDAVDRNVSSDDGLRKYEQTDPNNRDNA